MERVVPACRLPKTLKQTQPTREGSSALQTLRSNTRAAIHHPLNCPYRIQAAARVSDRLL
jgi:hypothetical protein